MNHALRQLTTKASGSRYSVQPPASALASQESIYSYAGTDAAADLGKLRSQTTLASDGTSRTTQFANYVLGKPEQVTDSTGLTTWSKVDPTTGNLMWTLGPTGEGMQYVYSGDPVDNFDPANPQYMRPDLPKGLLLYTYKIYDTNPAPLQETAPMSGHRLSLQPASASDYYAATDIPSGAIRGKLKSSTDTAGKSTFYQYDSNGDATRTYSLWQNPVSGQPNHWIVNSSYYDAAGRAIFSAVATFQDAGTAGTLDLSTTTVDANGNDTIAEPVITASTPINYPGLDLAGNPWTNSSAAAPERLTGQMHYNSLGKADWTADGYGAKTYFTYDARGNLIRTLNPDGTETRTSYDALGRAEWTSDRYVTGATSTSTVDNTTTSLATRTLYDSLGRASGTQRYQGVTIALNPDIAISTAGTPTEPILTAVPPNSVALLPFQQISTTGTQYNAQGQVSASTGADGITTTSEYYPNGQVLRTRPIVPAGSTTPQPDWTTQDSNRKQLDVLTLPGGITGLNSVGLTLTDTTAGTTQAPLTISVPVISTDSIKSVLAKLAIAINSQSSSPYQATAADTYLRLVSNEQVNGQDAGTFVVTLLTGVSDSSHVAVGTTNGWTIDPLGHVTVSDSNMFNRVAGAIVSREQRTTFNDGSFTQTLTSVGGQTIPGYAPQPIASGGTEVVKIAQHLQSETPVATESFSNAAGELTDVWQPLVAYTNTDPATAAVTTTGTAQPHWHYVYDANSHQTSQVGAKGNTTLFTFDDQGHQTGRTLPDAESESFAYDAYGRLFTHTDFNGNIATSTYEPNTDPHAGMLQQVQYVGASGSGKATQTLNYTYDNLGRPATVADASGTTTDHYDAQGNLIEQDTPQGTIYHTYDPATGRLTGVSTSATAESYGYDALGRLSSVSVNKLNGVALATPLVTTYGYDAAGNKASEALPDEELTTYTYDSLNRLKGLTETQGTTTLFSQSFILNSDGSRASVTENQRQADGSTVTSSTAWGYDALDRLTGETVTSSDTDKSYANTFAYDMSSNRTQQVHTGPGGGASDTTTFAYSGDDQLIFQSSVVNGTTAFAYDANGSELNSSSGGVTTAAYGYDVRNKMTSAQVGSGPASTYVYNDAGNRVRQTTAGTTTYYLTDTQNPTGYAEPIEQRPSPTSMPTVTYLIGNRAYGQVDSTGSVKFLLADGHGSTRLITDSGGNVTSALNYDAFGAANGFSLASAGTPFLFGGDALYDSASALYLHGDGVRGRSGFRFIEGDIQNNGSNDEPISLHKYLYSGGNPVNYWDPSGYFEFSLAGIQTAIGNALVITASVGIPALSAIQPYVAGITLLTFLAHPDAAADFLAQGGDPASLLAEITSDGRAIAQDAEELIVLGRSIYRQAKGAGTELSSLQGAVNQLDGMVFDGKVLDALGITAANEFKLTAQTSKGSVSTVPDLYEKLMIGIGDIKNVKDIAKTPQLDAQMTIAKMEDVPFNLIISPKTETVAQSLQRAARDTKGVIAKFDPATGLFTPVEFAPNSAQVTKN